MSWRRDPERGERWLLSAVGFNFRTCSEGTRSWARDREEEAFRRAKNQDDAREEYVRRLREAAREVREAGVQRLREGWEGVLGPVVEWAGRTVERELTDNSRAQGPTPEAVRKLAALRGQLKNRGEDPSTLCRRIIEAVAGANLPAVTAATEERLDKAMRSLGRCCALPERRLPSRSLYCSNDGCEIAPGGVYWHLKEASSPALGVNTHRLICEKCWKKGKLGSDNADRTDFEQLRLPGEGRREPTVRCSCGSEFHTACVGYSSPLTSTEFKCEDCLVLGGRATGACGDIRERFDMANLDCTPLTDGIQEELRRFVRQEGGGDSKLYVRLLSSSQAQLPTGPELRRHYPDLPTSLPYRKLFLILSQRQGKAQVPVAGSWVYCSEGEATPGNKQVAYLSYFESTCLFEPAELRSKILRRLVSETMAALSQAGYARYCFWACAPCSRTEDYVLAGRGTPLYLPDDLSPKDRRDALDKDLKDRQTKLLGFYHKMLKEAEDDSLIQGYQVLDGQSQGFDSITDFPFFSGDQIPDKVEELLAKERRKKKASRKMSEEEHEKELAKKALSLIENYFVVELRGRENVTLNELCPIKESVVAGSRLGLLDRMYREGWNFRGQRLSVFGLIQLTAAVVGERAGEPTGPLLAVLVHAVGCDDRGCRRSGCGSVARLLSHFRRCRRGRLDAPERGPDTKSCDDCAQLASLLYFHSSSCDRHPCPLPLCANLRRFAVAQTRNRRSL